MFSIGDGVHGFTLDPSMNEFILTDENVQIPFSGNFYSINEGHTDMFDENIRNMLYELKSQLALSQQKRRLRYVGSMVADIHRTIMYGGVYLYPAHTDRPHGRFKLLYEAAPLAFLVEQAGGQASNGVEPILDIIPRSVHDKLPVFMGSEYDVTFVCSFLNNQPQDDPLYLLRRPQSVDSQIKVHRGSSVSGDDINNDSDSDDLGEGIVCAHLPQLG
eukprot:Plantae.Rhodophyta-Purpureofilum_apyrenoidigerum.ctg41337.p1 GENE.Plantae.Rhodophyta-Purpureofilum_apyrenoidigerum.ctg41337~~Plantae.Rhodophyta-Purpureofilum_apyrenoidigerum.ctg41337.p1  ORF type:complete len:217 (+),score=38.23 Plantae.Rhodophyta-Purpureofilum_apyrenoidigerum.ctg41337:104-754(+)